MQSTDLTSIREHLLAEFNLWLDSLVSAQWFWIPGPLPGMNEIVEMRSKFAKKGKKRKRWNAYSEAKVEWENTICEIIKLEKLRPVSRATIRFDWVERHRRRDFDNIIAGQKFILDSLVAGKVLPDDSRKYVTGLDHRPPTVDADVPGVRVTIFEVVA